MLCILLASYMYLISLSLNPVGKVGLRTIISKTQLDKIARDLLITWEELSSSLELTQAQEKNIRRTYSEYEDQKREALRAWKRNKGEGATFGVLIAAAKDVSNMQLAHGIRDLMEKLRGKDAYINILWCEGRPNPPTKYWGDNSKLLVKYS